MKFSKGDIVIYTADFLRSTGQVTRPIDGIILGHRGDTALVMWNDADSPIRIAEGNLELVKKAEPWLVATADALLKEHPHANPPPGYQPREYAELFEGINDLFETFGNVYEDRMMPRWSRRHMNVELADGTTFSVGAGPRYYSSPASLRGPYEELEIGMASRPIPEFGTTESEGSLTYAWVPVESIDQVITEGGGVVRAGTDVRRDGRGRSKKGRRGAPYRTLAPTAPNRRLARLFRGGTRSIEIGDRTYQVADIEGLRAGRGVYITTEEGPRFFVFDGIESALDSVSAHKQTGSPLVIDIKGARPVHQHTGLTTELSKYDSYPGVAFLDKGRITMANKKAKKAKKAKRAKGSPSKAWVRYGSENLYISPAIDPRYPFHYILLKVDDKKWGVGLTNVVTEELVEIIEPATHGTARAAELAAEKKFPKGTKPAWRARSRDSAKAAVEAMKEREALGISIAEVAANPCFGMHVHHDDLPVVFEQMRKALKQNPEYQGLRYRLGYLYDYGPAAAAEGDDTLVELGLVEQARDKVDLTPQARRWFDQGAAANPKRTSRNKLKQRLMR